MPPEDDLNAWVAGAGDPLNDWVNPPPEQAARARGLGAALDIVPEESQKAHHPSEVAPLSTLPEGVEPTEGMKAQGGHFPFETEDLPRLQKRLSEAGVDADTIQKTMQQFRSPQAVQGRQFDRAVKEAARQPEDWTRYVVGKLPIAGGMADYLQSQAGQETAARFQAGQATQQDIERLAREQVAGAREEVKGTGRKVVDMAAGLPAFLTEWSMLGGPAGYLGKAAEGAVGGGLLGQAARVGTEAAARTALRPDVLAERSDEGAIKGAGSAFLENLIWTAAGGPAPKPGATAAGGLVTNYLRTQAAAEANKAGQSLLSGKGGGSTLQQLANARTDGERDKALSDLAAEAAVFGGLAGAHAIPGAVEALKPAEREWLQHSIMDSLTPEPELLPPLSPLEGIGMLRPEGQGRFAGTPQQGFTPQEAPGGPQTAPQPAPAPTPAPAPPTPPAQSQTPSRPKPPFTDVSFEDVKGIAKALGLSAKGGKDDVVARISKGLPEDKLRELEASALGQPPPEVPQAPPAAPEAQPAPEPPPTPPGVRYSRKELLDRIEAGEGGLTPEEKTVLNERLLYGTSFREIAAETKLGSYTTVENIEKGGLAKLGHEGTVDEVHAAGRGGQAVADAARGKEIRVQDLHEKNATYAASNNAVEQIGEANDRIDALLRRQMKLEQAGKLTPKIKADIHAEYERLKGVIDKVTAGTEPAAHVPPETGAAPEPTPAEPDRGRGPAAGGAGGPDQAEAAGAGAAPAGPEAGARGAGAPEPAGGAAAGMKEAWEAGKKVGVLGDYNPGASLKEKLHDFGRVDTENLDDIYARLKPGAGSSNERLRVLSSAYDSLLAEAQGRLPPTADRINKRMDAVKRGIEEVVPQLRDIGGMGAAADFYEKYGPGLVEEARQDLLGRVGGAEPAGQHPNVAAGKPFAMGAAALGELPPAGPGERPDRVALANAEVDRQLAARGMAPVLGSVRAEDPVTWAEAMRRVEADPGLGKKLVDEVTAKSRPLSDVEQLVLLHRHVGLLNDSYALDEQVNEAKGPRGKLDSIDLATLEDRADQARRDLYETALAVKRTGSDIGRSLRVRRLMSDAEFNLKGMLGRAMAAKGGPLTAEESAKVKEMSERIGELQKRLDAALAAGEPAIDPGTGRPSAELTGRDAGQNEARRYVRGLGEKNQGWGAWLADKWLKARVNWLISGPTTLLKLADTAATGLVVNPAVEAAGSAWRQVPFLRRIFKEAPREGAGFRPGVEGKAALDFFRYGAAEALKKLRTGHTTLEEAHDPNAALPQSFLDYQFRLHDAAKEPLAQSEYTRSYLSRLEHAARKGEDVTAPSVTLRLSAEAYADAVAAKFRGPNVAAEAINRGINWLRDPGQRAGVQAAGALLKGTVPIVKIPLNIISQTGQYLFGTGTGSVRAIAAYARGIENLKPAEADLIAQSFKRGSVGLGLAVLGFARPEMFGGYYDRDREKKKGEGEPKAGEAKVGETTVPAWAMHHPALQAGQFGATLRRAYDDLTERDADAGKAEKGASAFIAAVVGMAQDTPLVRETADVQKVVDSRQRGRFFGEYLKSLTVPQLVQWLAKHSDVEPGTGNWLTGEPVKRKPEGVLEHVGEGVPWLRQRVESR